MTGQEMVEQYMVKFAGMGVGQRLGAGALFGLGIVGASKFVEEIVEYLRERNLASKSGQYYTKMLLAHPELRKENSKLVAKYWASLYHFAPFMAQDPLAAGAFIRQSIARGLPEEFGGPAPDTYLTLADINRKIMQARTGSEIAKDYGGEATKAFVSGAIKGLVSGGPNSLLGA